jgi:hypothetical protein
MSRMILRFLRRLDLFNLILIKVGLCLNLLLNTQVTGELLLPHDDLFYIKKNKKVFLDAGDNLRIGFD